MADIMMKARRFLHETHWRIQVAFQLIIIICSYIDVSCAAPPDHCFEPLNTEDCNLPPTRVFYYYKPGSRCEIGIWRGCPTLNKFEDQIECTQHCIARYGNNDEDNTFDDENAEPKIEEEIQEWKDELNQIPAEDAVAIDNILDEVLDQEHDKVKLKFTVAPTDEPTDAEENSPKHSTPTAAEPAMEPEDTVPSDSTTPMEEGEATEVITT